MTNHTDHGVTPREACVLRYLLDDRAAAFPDRTYVVFEDGAGWTYAQFRQRVRAAAEGLEKLGVRRGDHVMVWLPNGPEILTVWFAINYLGAVYVPFNTAYRGGLLAHVVENSDARLAIVHAELMPRLTER